MRFDVVTLFPELFAPHFASGVTQRAFASGQVDVHLWQLREFAEGNYRRVDDRPYGGGPGMVLTAPPLLRAVDAIQLDRGRRAEVILFSPSGRPLTQALVAELASGDGATLVCGRYEGVDQRFIDARVTQQVSIGDFVLSGGELPALMVLDAVARLQPGVLSPGSAELESFADGLLEGPCWTRPEALEIDGVEQRVPALLTQGHHAQMARERRRAALLATARKRPDLIAAARDAGRLSAQDEQTLDAASL